MRKSLIASLVVHSAILIAALVVLPNPEAFKVKQQDSIQVDISMIGDVSKRKATAKVEAPKAEKPAPKKVDTVKKVEPAPKVAEEVKTAAKEPTAPPPPPEPKKAEPKKEEEPKPLDPDPLKELVEKIEEPKPKEEVKKAEVTPEKKKPEKKKIAKKKPELNVDDISAFLNKVDDEKTAPEQPSDVTGSPELAETNVQGTDDAMGATLVEAMSQKLRECWSVPPGALEANIRVRVKWSLSRDGNVAGQPEVLNSNSDPLFDATARSAVAAVFLCQSYSDILPPDRYDMWKEFIMNFDPRMMFGT